MVKVWRLIPPFDLTLLLTLDRHGADVHSIASPGKLQMAIDSWLLNQHLLGHIPPTLRFYTWANPTISLGYHQRHYPEHWNDLSWGNRQIDLAKRPTGGRGVLHQGDLTYAIVCSGFVGRRVDIYQQICQFLIDGWRGLGVDLTYGKTKHGYIHNPNCFGTATSADLICADGYKLIGSAQLIKSGNVLQHGSMRLNPDRALFQRVFGEIINPPPLGIDRLEISTIIDTLTDAAAKCFNMNFKIQPLSDREWADISHYAAKLDI